MDYEEYQNLMQNVFEYLEKENEYYKCMFVYFSFMLMQIGEDVSDVAALVGDYFNDVIEDSETEKAIIDVIRTNTESIINECTLVFFEGSPKFNLYEKMLKRINNSAKRRMMDAYPVISQFNSLISHRVVEEANYHTVKRRKYMSNKEYQDYLNVLKNKE